MVKDEWDGGDPLADITRFIQATLEDTGFYDVREVPGFYCRACGHEVAALILVAKFMGMERLGEPICSICQAVWPILLDRR